MASYFMRRLGKKVAASRAVTNRPRAVVDEPTFTEPISGRAVAHATITGTSSVVRNENERKLPPCSLGTAIVIDDGSGRAEVKLRDVHLLSRHVQSYCEHNEGPLPALRAHFQIPANESLDVQEMAIDPGDELWVVGRVESVEENPLEQPGGDREPSMRRKVIVGPDRAGLRVSMTSQRVGELDARSPCLRLIAPCARSWTGSRLVAKACDDAELDASGQRRLNPPRCSSPRSSP